MSTSYDFIYFVKFLWQQCGFLKWADEFKSRDLLHFLLPGLGERARHSLRKDACAVLGVAAGFLGSSG